MTPIRDKHAQQYDTPLPPSESHTYITAWIGIDARVAAAEALPSLPAPSAARLTPADFR